MNKTEYKFVTIANGRSDITLHEPIYKGLKKNSEPTPEPEPEPEPDVVRLIEKYFPDPNFRAALTDALGVNEGDEIKPDEYQLYEGAELNVSNHSIDDLEGIQYIGASDCVINCRNNNLTSLDLSSSSFLPLIGCLCQCNKITHLVFYDGSDICHYYRSIECYENQIKGEEMDALIESLPNAAVVGASDAGIVIINTASENEGNVCTKTQVQALKDKGWKAYDYNGGSLVEYEGSDPEWRRVVIPGEASFNYEGEELLLWDKDEDNGGNYIELGIEPSGNIIRGKIVIDAAPFQYDTFGLCFYTKDGKKLITEYDINNEDSDARLLEQHLIYPHETSEPFRLYEIEKITICSATGPFRIFAFTPVIENE